MQSDLKERIKLQSPKILLVEDDAISRRFIKAILTDFGCRVDAVENAKQALELFNNNFDLILSDLGLPDMSGIELAKAIRQKECDNYHVPLIALTGQMAGDFKEVCLQAGMDDFMEKPVNKERLLQILTLAL